MSNSEEKIREKLYTLQDTGYRDFHSRLIPNIDKENVIGVRAPQLRRLAKELYGTSEAEEFMRALPHKYYEENTLHAYLIEKITDFTECVARIEEFLPYIDNWATCDQMNPKVKADDAPALLEHVRRWITSDHTYTVRFGIKCLMNYYLDDRFDEKYLSLVADIRHEDYYVKMMIAWYFATALAKQWDAALPYIEDRCLDDMIHKKAIQKAVESFRITAAQKETLKLLR